MRRFAALALALVASLLGGCSLAPTLTGQVPEGYAGTACRAYRLLGTALAERSPLLMRSSLDEADRWLAGIPEWDPGAVWVVQLAALRDALRSVVDDGVAIDAVRGGSRPADVDAGYEALVAAHGLSCPA